MRLNIFDILKENFADKNNLDSNGRLRITPEMQTMFSNPKDTMNGSKEDYSYQITYKEIPVDDLKTRPITENEFNQLSAFQTNILLRLPYFFIFVFGILDIFIAICLLNNLKTLTITDKGMMIFIMVVFLLVIGYSIRSSLNTIVRRDSQIAKGSVVFFGEKLTHYNNKSRTIYYVTVAFHDQQTFVKNIYCNEREGKILEVDSVVYVVVKGRRAFAVAAGKDEIR